MTVFKSTQIWVVSYTAIDTWRFFYTEWNKQEILKIPGNTLFLTEVFHVVKKKKKKSYNLKERYEFLWSERWQTVRFM